MRCNLQILAILLIVLSLGCAKQAPPPGGIEDKTGPVIVKHFPESGAVNVDPRMVVELEFSEFVNRPSVESSLFLSPDPIMRLKYKWSGRTLKLIYLDPLQADRTYVVSVGSEAKDLRANPAGSTTTIAFSTGDELDRGRFHGWIDGVEKPQTVSIWAYLLADSVFPDPMTDIAEYRIQAKTNGSFNLEYLKTGEYRVFAVADRNRDGLWNPVSELIGTAPMDFTVTDLNDPWISFLPVLQDTSMISIRRTKQIDSGRFDLKVSRVVRSCNCSFIDSTGLPVKVIDSYSQEEEPETWTLFTESELTPGFWIASCSGVDLLNRSWETTDTIDVIEKPDTLRPMLVSGWPTDYPAIAVSPDSVLLTFDEPVVYTPLPDSSLMIASSRDSLEVAVRQYSGRSILFSPSAPVDSGGRYQLTFNGQTIADLSGNVLSDTTVLYPFAVIPPDSLGAILGTFNSTVGGQYLLKLISLANGTVWDSSTVAVGTFRFDGIPSGKYLMKVIRDLNRDGELSSGSMLPFEFSEPYFQLADTVSVRARWEYETDINWIPNP